MRWKSLMTSASIVLLMLAMVSLLAGCETIQPTHTTVTESRIAAGVCRVWQPVTYSNSRDTAETILQVRANNAARDTYCMGATK